MRSAASQAFQEDAEVGLFPIPGQFMSHDDARATAHSHSSLVQVAGKDLRSYLDHTVNSL